MQTVQRQRYRAAYDSIIRLCGQGLPDGELFARLSGQLRKAVAFRTAGWLRLDPMTLLPLPGLLLQADHDRVSRIIHSEYFEPDVMKFRELAHAKVPAQSLRQATGGRPRRSTRYRTIQAQLGYGDDLRVVFRRGGTAWGAACLARAAADPPFSRDEICFLARVCERVGRGLRLSHLLAGDRPAGPRRPAC
jgi:hypothetical protein